MQLNSLSCTASLKDSQIGSISLTFFSTVIGFLCPRVIVPMANKRIANGFPLPTIQKLMLVKPQLQLGIGYMVFNTDVYYTGQEVPMHWLHLFFSFFDFATVRSLLRGFCAFVSLVPEFVQSRLCNLMSFIRDCGLTRLGNPLL